MEAVGLEALKFIQQRRTGRCESNRTSPQLRSECLRRNLPLGDSVRIGSQRVCADAVAKHQGVAVAYVVIEPDRPAVFSLRMLGKLTGGKTRS